jgi:hypothetical protein
MVRNAAPGVRKNLTSTLWFAPGDLALAQRFQQVDAHGGEFDPC